MVYTQNTAKNFLCVILSVALVGSWLLPPRKLVIVIVEPIESSIYDRIDFISFEKNDELLMRAELLPKFARRCSEAFTAAGLRSPAQLARESGIVFRHFSDLKWYRARTLGLMSEEILHLYQTEFSSGRAQAGTVPPVRDGIRLTTDNRPRIFIHDAAFLGESFWFGRVSLGDVLTHELIHAGGQPPTPGWLWFMQHDLAGFGPYDEIIEACR